MTSTPTVVNGYGLGRLVSHDLRSRNFPAPRATQRRPKVHRIYGSVLYQGNTGSCTGNAAAAAMNSGALRRLGSKPLTEADALAFYSSATRLDTFPGTYPPDDTGSSGLAVAKALQQLGKITSYTHAFGLEHLLDALQLAPVLIGIGWHQSMFEPDARGYVHPDGNIVGGHELCVRGDDGKGSVLVRNSWSDSWGIRGDCRMTYAVLGSLLADDGDATVLVR